VVSFTARHFTSGETSPGTHWIGGWLGPRAGLDKMEKRKFLTLTGLKLRTVGRPARSQSLHRLRYPGSLNTYLLCILRRAERPTLLQPRASPLAQYNVRPGVGKAEIFHYRCRNA
jgi:hypothetical protein